VSTVASSPFIGGQWFCLRRWHKQDFGRRWQWTAIRFGHL